MTILSQEKVTAICENGHTKGPWFKKSGDFFDDVLEVYAPCEDGIGIYVMSEQAACIADSHLIAASPDLAETAKHLYEENARLRAGMRYALASVNALASHRFDMLSTNDVPVLDMYLNDARAALGANK